MPYADPEKRREYNRQWYRQWYAENREKKREYDLRYRAANKEKIREYYRQYDRQRRAVNPEKRLEYKRRHYAKLRTQVLALLGGKCARCGLVEDQLLQVDHINGGGNIEHKALGYYGILRKVLADPTRYQLLCANCNWQKRYERGENHKKHLSERNLTSQSNL